MTTAAVEQTLDDATLSATATNQAIISASADVVLDDATCSAQASRYYPHRVWRRRVGFPPGRLYKTGNQ